MPARTLMIQGTSSSVGKSLLVAGLCRIFARRGIRVAPFKAQNMSNNAAVCADGSEIGRAQAVQAAAAGIEPTAQMNPILLKPEGHARSQVIVLGRPWHSLAAAAFYQRKQELWPIVTTALAELRERFELVIIEGAGSPVELNSAAGDIVNMAIARHAGSPVLLAGDIDRGGIFAQLLGTLWLLPPEERTLVKGLIVNRFRGDPALFADGLQILEQRGEVPVLGVVPFVDGLDVPEEDAVALDHELRHKSDRQVTLDIAVIHLPHIANFDDFDPLRREPGVRLRFVAGTAELGRPDAIILPGTKTTISDLGWLRAQGLAGAIIELARAGTAMVGICGGYQMLGRTIRDPEHVESSAAEVAGLGVLPVDTCFDRAKATHRVNARIVGGPGWLSVLAGQTVTGYEIHMGRTPSASPWLTLRREGTEPMALPDGAVSDSGKIWGCYVHGLFANEYFRRAWLDNVAAKKERVSGSPAMAHEDSLVNSLDKWADVLETSLNMGAIERMADL